MSLTRAQRRGLAMAVLSEVGNLVEFWNEKVQASPPQWQLDDIEPDEAAQIIANWLAPLPTGDQWPCQLPQPTVKC